MAVSGLVVGLPRAAQAQLTPSVTVPSQGVTHSDQSQRSGYRLNTQINFADCSTYDDVITFGVDFANRGTYPMQIWAGNNSCTTATNRTTTTLSGCWLLYNATPTSNQITVSLHVRDILWGQTEGAVTVGTTTTAGTGGTTDDAGIAGGAGTGGTGGDTTDAGTTTTTSTLPTGTLITGSDANACVDKSGNTAPQSLAVTFMLIDTSNANAVAGSAAIWTATYKLLAPIAPTSVSASVGDGLLPIQFSYPDNQSNDTTINGYQFFCDPPPGSEALADAGIVPVATDAGQVTPNCQSSQLIPGTMADPKFACGTASLSATSGNATGLTNGVSYNVGVAATDTYQNIGDISILTCQVPQPVDGFFKAYRAAGGAGGGGFCSFSMKREPMPLLVLLALASCLVLRRRRVA